MIDEHLKPQGTIDPDRGKKGADREEAGAFISSRFPLTMRRRAFGAGLG
jgi:hypothetical protein